MSPRPRIGYGVNSGRGPEPSGLEIDNGERLVAIPSYRIAFDGEAAADDIYEHIIRLEIEESTERAASFMFRVSIAQQEDGEWSYLDDERLALFKKVTISLGFGEGNAAPVLEGYITHLAPHFDPQEELCYLEVRGMDPSCVMNLEEKLVTWADQSHSDIASAIFSSYGFTADVADAPVVHAEDGNVLVQRGTDIRFLKDLAARNGYDCYVAVDDSGQVKGCFKPAALDAAPLPPLAVHFEGETNVQSLDIQVTGNRPLGVSGWQLSLADKSLEPVEITEYGLTALGSDTLPGIVSQGVQALAGGAVAYQGDLVSLDSVELERALQGRHDRQGWFIKANGVITGEGYGAAIRARRIIPVKGMGTRYSGNYFVTSVKHVIAGGEYEQRVELLRNAWGVTGNESFEGES